MNDVTALFNDLEVVLMRIEGKLIVELRALPEEDLEETLEALDREYDGQAQAGY